VLKRAYFMALIDGVFWLPVIYKRESSHLSGVKPELSKSWSKLSR